jgi:ribosomal protein S18 acetylase RimI-like enzyme
MNAFTTMIRPFHIHSLPVLLLSTFWYLYLRRSLVFVNSFSSALVISGSTISRKFRIARRTVAPDNKNIDNVTAESSITYDNAVFSIHPVTTRERTLDVLLFRHGKLVQTVDQYCQTHPDCTQDEALQRLTCDTFDNSNLHQFYATIDESSELFSKFPPGFLDHTHGVIGSVDVEAVASTTTTTSNLLELKNLRVHEAARRQGMGKALLQAVQNHALSMGANVYLEVDSDNLGAIELYQQMGFSSEKDNANRMTWTLPSNIQK